jgi:hypothetical protein
MSTVDIARWDAAGRYLELPLGRVHESVELYGSGGFPALEPADQLSDWAHTKRIP